jgi:hypothetical protein
MVSYVDEQHMPMSSELQNILQKRELKNFNLNCGGHRQGNQIGRIFAQWVLDYFWLFFLNYKSTYPTFLATFSTVKVLH